MADMEKVIRIIDELIFEAQKAPTWKAENAWRCLKKELLKEQEAVEPIVEHRLFICPVCKNSLFRGQKFCHECGRHILWEGR